MQEGFRCHHFAEAAAGVVLSKAKQADHKRRDNGKKERAAQQIGHSRSGSESGSKYLRPMQHRRHARLERGLTLERTCAALGMDLSSLFREVEQTRGEAQLINAADQMEVVRSGTKHGHTYRLLSHHKSPCKIFEPFPINMVSEVTFF
ncbi:hypothetical protein [Bradyrhizobium sp. USDA 10063]